MKKLGIIGLIVVIAVTCLLLHWQHAKIAKMDSDIGQNIAGTWSSQLDVMTLTNVVMADGSFTSKLIFVHPQQTNTYQESGSWVVKDGKMIETVTRDTNPTALTPRTRVGRILGADASGFTVQWQGSPDEWIWHKVVQ